MLAGTARGLWPEQCVYRFSPKLLISRYLSSEQSGGIDTALYVFEEKCSALRPLRRLPYKLPAEFRPLVFQPRAVKGRLAGHCGSPQT